MATTSTGTYQITGWDEQPYDEKDGVKLTKATISNGFTGDISGDGKAEYLMAYAGDSYASFVGLQKVTGTVAGRSGSFVLQVSGTYEGGTAKADWFVVPGSGTGELSGLTGRGGYRSSGGTSAEYTLEYSLG